MHFAIRSIAAAIWLFATPVGGHAQQSQITPEARAAATAVVQITGSDTMIARIMDAMRNSLVQLLVKHGHVTQEKAIFACDNVLMPAMKAHAFELRAAITEVYAENFSLAELTGLKTFYESPLGKKLLEKLPLVAAESADVGRTFGERIVRDALEANRQKLQQMGITL